MGRCHCKQKKLTVDQFDAYLKQLEVKYDNSPASLLKVHRTASEIYESTYQDLKRADEALSKAIETSMLINLITLRERLVLQKRHADLVSKIKSRKEAAVEYLKVVEVMNQQVSQKGFIRNRAFPKNEAVYIDCIYIYQSAALDAIIHLDSKQQKSIFLIRLAFVHFCRNNPLLVTNLNEVSITTSDWEDTILFLNHSLEYKTSILGHKLSQKERETIQNCISLLKESIIKKSNLRRNQFINKKALKEEQKKLLDPNSFFYNPNSPFLKK